MKKIKFSGKLFLEKSTIAQLDDNQLAGINGGKQSDSNSCPTSYTCFCTYTCPDPCTCKCAQA